MKSEPLFFGIVVTIIVTTKDIEILRKENVAYDPLDMPVAKYANTR